MSDLVEFVKNHRFVYSMYFHVTSFLLNIAKVFVKSDNDLVLFVSYGGRKLCDSPYDIYKMMRTDKRFEKKKLVWAFRNPEEYPEIDLKTKIDTVDYFITALKARCWITNVSIERGLRFKGKNTLYVHTTHVTLPKKMGYHLGDSEAFSSLGGFYFDYSCAQSDYEAELQRSMFGLKEDQILRFGYPKNDQLIQKNNALIKKELREKFGIPKNKKTILYAPTYREGTDEVIAPLDIEKWKKELGRDFVLLFRVHPILANRMNLEAYPDFVIDVSDYDDNTEVMLVSDMLVSDYSGIFFEYGVLNRPMYCYAYDYEEYTGKRPLYFDIRSELPGGTLSEDELIEHIRNGTDTNEDKLLQNFRNKYIQYCGTATQQCVDFIYEKTNTAGCTE